MILDASRGLCLGVLKGGILIGMRSYLSISDGRLETLNSGHSAAGSKSFRTSPCGPLNRREAG